MSGLPLGEGKVIKVEKLKIGDIICVNGISCEIAGMYKPDINNHS